MDEITDEMRDWYHERTDKHIGLVQKYCEKLSHLYPELLERGKVHDKSKYESPEYPASIFTVWRYRAKDLGIDFKMSEETEKAMLESTKAHVTNPKNDHHPEATDPDKAKKSLINENDRDKPPKQIIDGGFMEDISVAEMCCDWAAMSRERGGDPRDWADQNVNVRWKFNPEQEGIIYDCLEELCHGEKWENESEEE